MNDEDPSNPWITVSKRRKVNATSNGDHSPSFVTKSEAETFHTNSFTNLSIQDIGTDNLANGKDTKDPSNSTSSSSPPHKKNKKEKSRYPSITIPEEFTNKKISLADFRDLVLWMLEDSHSPDWIHIRNKSAIKACVVILAPGLTPQTFDIDPTNGSEGRRMRVLKDIETNPLPKMSEIFKYMWFPKAPGTNTAVYSPAVMFLNCPLSATQQKAKRQAQPNGNSISLEALLLKSVAMRNAGYPIHPLHEPGNLQTGMVHTPIATEPTEKVVIGLDCEMCRTSAGSEITRVTLVDFHGNTLYDELVKPNNPIIDYLTPWSGITEERLLNTTTTLSMVQTNLLQILDSDTILVGHSLECDLQALKLAHPHVIDTSVIYQHSRGPPSKPSLRWLSQKWLNRAIQQHETGHDSAEDAKACVDLLKLKLRKGKDFGLFNVDTESLFTRLQRKGIESAVVEVGSKGGFAYGDKVRSCVNVESDGEVVDEILEGLKTDHAFVWARMKQLEIMSRLDDVERQTEDKMKVALAEFDENIARLWDSLPACTALMVISGTGDATEMTRLYAKKKIYDAELKAKSWDAIKEKWSSDDLEALNFAVDKARTGLGFIAIK